MNNQQVAHSDASRNGKATYGEPRFSYLSAIEREILGIFENTLRFNEELASIKNTYGEDPLIFSAADHLQAISEETTAATGEIVAAAASTQLVTSDLKVQIKYGGADRLFDEIRVNVS